MPMFYLLQVLTQISNLIFRLSVFMPVTSTDGMNKSMRLLFVHLDKRTGFLPRVNRNGQKVHEKRYIFNKRMQEKKSFYKSLFHMLIYLACGFYSIWSI